MKFVIIKADNGFIVKYINCGLSMMHEPYFKPLMVFEDFQTMVNAIKEACEKSEK